MRDNRLLILNKENDKLEEKKMSFEKIELSDRSKVKLIKLYKMNEESEAILIKYEEDGKFTRHVHEGYELAYILDGIMCTNQGIVKKGDIVLFPPGSEHEGICNKDFIALVVREPKLTNIKESYE